MGQDVVTAMALLTGGNIRRFPYQAPAMLDIDLKGFLMTDTAIRLGKFQGVGNPFNIVVAVRAGKILVNAATQIFGGNFRRYPAGVGVAIRADLVGEFHGESKGDGSGK